MREREREREIDVVVQTGWMDGLRERERERDWIEFCVRACVEGMRDTNDDDDDDADR